MSTKLRDDFLRLLDEDKDFRYAVAGYLGLSDIMKRLDAIEENLTKIWNEIKELKESIKLLWQEVRELREGQNRLWEEVKELREGQNKLWEEVKSLREGQNKLWEEVRELREGQNKLWEGQNRLWEEVKGLREGQNRLWEEVKLLREEQVELRLGQNKLWTEVKELRRAYEGLSKKVSAGFAELGSALGVTYEIHAAAYIQVLLEELGFPWAKVRRGYVLKDGEVLEVDVFCEEPLVVGEVTASLRTVEEAGGEMTKLLERVEAVSMRYGRRPFLAVLSVGVAPDDVAEMLREKAEEHGVKLILGREIEEAFGG
ncbi:MAG: hypothetical protein RMI43_06575 [Candidatus Caldarchaeum sp.]|nr:hypothetical protein [Candidatus Caldarchaeum sp.]